MYLALYTPLKRKTPLCTLVGAVPGAMPPLIGWAAASGTLGGQAWTLYAMLFLWQFPHFMAIAWMYREDYRRAGYLVLPRGDHGGRFMSLKAIAASLILVPVGLGPVTSGGAGLGNTVADFLLSAGSFYFSACLAFARSNAAARQLLMASIIYLPAAFFLKVFEKS
jgi:heme o synthase